MKTKGQKKLRLFGILAAFSAIFFIAGCGLRATPPKRYPIKLEVWGLFDDSDAFSAAIGAYQKANPNVTGINYKKLTPDTYQKDLLDALASGQGPDIILIQNTWLPSFEDKIVPVTPDILTEQNYRAEFPDVVANDFIDQGKIYATPLSVDSLALYYNKDLFNQAGITAPPASWNDFTTEAKQLTKIDGTGNITQSGAALGTAYNIKRSTDILNLLMMQENTPMLDDRQSRANFDQGSVSASNGNASYPGVAALTFYTNFAKTNSSFYSWNPNMHYSLDAFSEGTLAMMLDYSWDISTIRNKAPKLNFTIAPVPQLNPAAPVNFPNYWAFAVAKNKTSAMPVSGSQQPVQIPNTVRAAEAWSFLKYLTDKPVAAAGQNPSTVFDPAADFLKKTGHPAARKDLIEKQKTDVDLGAFAAGNLVAKDWKEVNPPAIETIFASMIDSVNKGSMSVNDALKAAAAQVSQLMNNQ